MVFSSPVFYQEVHIGQGFLDLFRIGGGLIHFVNGKHDGYVGCHSMVDGFFGLGHYVVIGCDDDDGNVGYLCTAGTHGGKGFVTRCVQEGDVTTVFQGDIVSTNVLRDTAGLTGNDVGVADIVEQ